MVTKHFLKTLLMFTLMIIIGLIGVFLCGYFGKDGGSVNTSGKIDVAK